jgi:hypothetical protein
MIDRYNEITSKDDNFNPIRRKPFIPNPKEGDYKRGYIVRYFVHSVNNQSTPIFEVNKQGYLKYSINSFYTTVTLDWRLTGSNDVIKKSNRESVRIASQTIPKISLYLPNLLQFHQK